MSYFSKFPKFVYEQGGLKSVAQDILVRSAFLSEYKNKRNLFTNYMIIDGETSQSLAKRFYDSPKYHWVITLFNELHNPYFEWPLDSFVLRSYVEEKYGIDTMFVMRHNEKDGEIVGEIKEWSKDIPWVPPPQLSDAIPISFYDYEEMLNDEKRTISIMRKELLGEFLKQFEASLNG
jgi:hypothetical protein